jgi:hypothetical protein
VGLLAARHAAQARCEAGVIKPRAVFCQVSRLALRGTMPKLRRSTHGGNSRVEAISFRLEGGPAPPGDFLCRALFVRLLFVRLHLFADI